MNDATKRKRSYAMGYLTSICGPVVSFPDKQPTAYSYNGVVLPDIETVYTPELQKEYPYVYIDEIASAQFGAACIMRGAYCKQYAGEMALFCESLMISIIKNGVWGEFEPNPYFKERVCFVDEILWVNKDIKDENDNVVLVGTDPIPVYE